MKVANLKSLLILMLIVVLGLWMTACDELGDIPGDDDPALYTLTVEVEGPGQGQVEPETKEVEAGTSITLEVIAEDDSAFYRWYGPDAGDVVEDTDTYKINMNADKEISARFLPKPEVITSYEEHEEGERIWSVALSPDGSQVLSGSRDDTARLWDADDGALKQFFEYDDSVGSVIFNSDGSRAVTAAGDLGGGIIEDWKTETGEIINSLEYDRALNSLAYAPDDSMVAAGEGYRDQALMIWKSDTGEIIREIEEDEDFNAVVFCSDSERVFAGLDSGIKVWEIESGELVNDFNGYEGEVRSLDLSADDSIAVSSALAEGVKVWNVDTGEVITTFLEHESIVESVSISSDGSKVVSGSRDETVKVWDANTGEVLSNFTQHDAGVWAADISSDGSRIVSGSDKGVVKVWEWDTIE